MSGIPGDFPRPYLVTLIFYFPCTLIPRVIIIAPSGLSYITLLPNYSHLYTPLYVVCVNPFCCLYVCAVSLSGGFVEVGESIESATIREVKEETNVDLTRADIDQFRVYSDPQRDQRRHTVSDK